MYLYHWTHRLDTTSNSLDKTNILLGGTGQEMLFKDFRKTDIYKNADVVTFLNKNGEEIDR